MMVGVFKTNVRDKEEAERTRQALLAQFPHWDVHFDLEDCERILRIEGESVDCAGVIAALEGSGIFCEELD